MKAFRNLFRRMGIAALWYAGIFSAVIIIWQIIFRVLGISEEFTIGETTIILISELSCRIYMLVIGIVSPLVYFPHYISAGVTRRQFALAIFAVAAVLSSGFAVLRIPLMVVYGGFSPLAVLVPALYGALAFLSGWTASVGFQYMRIIPIIAGIACPTALFHGMLALERLSLPLWSHLPIFICTIAIIGLALLKVVRQIPVKC